MHFQENKEAFYYCTVIGLVMDLNHEQPLQVFLFHHYPYAPIWTLKDTYALLGKVDLVQAGKTPVTETTHC